MKRYCFVDMHIHSIFSNEEGCVQTPAEILEQVLEIVAKEQKKERDFIVSSILTPNVNKFEFFSKRYRLESEEERQKLRDILKLRDPYEVAEKLAGNFIRACISITDHNSILGSLNALDEIQKNPEKYASIDFIPGIEFNAGLKELGTNDRGNSIYSKCHILAYGYNPEDKGMKLFSELFQLTIGKKPINIGHSILASRNMFRDNYGVTIPLSKFAELLEIGKQAEFDPKPASVYKEMRTKFYKICESYLPQGKKIEDFEAQSRQTFPKDAVSVEKNVGYGKLRISEIGELIAEANGHMVLAHPKIIAKEKRLIHGETEFKQMLEDLVERIQRVTGGKLCGLEAYHQNCSEYLEPILQVAEKNNLYVTGGSDNHGMTLYRENKISKCFGKTYEFNSTFDPGLWPEQIKNRIATLAILDMLLKKPVQIPNKQYTVVRRVDGSQYTNSEIMRISKMAYRARKEMSKTSGSVVAQPAKQKKQKLTPREMKKLQKRMERQRRIEEATAHEIYGEGESSVGQERPSNLMEYKKQWRESYLKEHELESAESKVENQAEIATDNNEKSSGDDGREE